MFRQFLRKFKKRRYTEINPEDIFLDSTNLPGFDEDRFEGRIERPMGNTTFLFLRVTLLLIVFVLGGRLWALEINNGEKYAEISEKNRLEHTVVFANRGVIYDRNHLELATNAIKEGGADFAARQYAPMQGLAHVVGYLKYPSKDAKGFYYDIEYKGRDGVERYYNHILAGKNGKKLVETDALGNVTSESVIDRPEDGKPVRLALDARVTEALYKAIASTAEERGFTGGAAVIMDVNTGEVLALTSYPEYDQNIVTSGERGAITRLLNDKSKPFLNRVIGGLYTPGSILKPVVAIAALNEGIISPQKQILSTGQLVVPNPYDKSKPSIFRDWKAHGYTNMQQALAVSSDVYFYTIGGGFGSQRGLGIDIIDRYFRLFGVTDKTGIDLHGETSGIIPTPEWKAERFNGDPWRLGDTYITAIGQYGTQLTPIEAVRFAAAIANEGRLVRPTVLLGGNEGDAVEREVVFAKKDWQVIKEGMKLGVEEGTSIGLNMVNVEVAAKTGTAEIGAGKKYIHSWSVGFFPYQNPKYAFALVMEHGPAENKVGATSVMRRVMDWMTIYTPEYLQ